MPHTSVIVAFGSKPTPVAVEAEPAVPKFGISVSLGAGTLKVAVAVTPVLSPTAITRYALGVAMLGTVKVNAGTALGGPKLPALSVLPASVPRTVSVMGKPMGQNQMKRTRSLAPKSVPVMAMGVFG